LTYNPPFKSMIMLSIIKINQFYQITRCSDSHANLSITLFNSKGCHLQFSTILKRWLKCINWAV